MEYLGITSPIDALKEKEAILEFLKDYWIIKSRKDFNLEEIIELILRKGIDRGIAFQEREIVRGAYLLRTAIECIKQHTIIVLPEYLDKIEIISLNYDYKEFPEHVEDLALRLENKYEYIFAEPIDYRIQQRESRGEKYAFFKGAKLHETIFKNWPSFEELINRETVEKFDNEHLTSPLKTLIGAVLRQGMNIGVYCVEEKYGKLIHPKKYRPLKQN